MHLRHQFLHVALVPIAFVTVLARASAVTPDQGVATQFPQIAGTPAPAAATRGVIIGVVDDASSGRGVQNAVVRLTSRGASQTKLTDAKGRFYFKDLPAGSFSLTAVKSGFFDGAYNKRRPSGSGTPLVLYDNQWVTDVKIDLWRPATIGGFVVDETNDPVVGAAVTALQRQFSSGHLTLVAAATAVTDDQGEYRLTGLTPGDYVVAVPQSQVTVPTSTMLTLPTSAMSLNSSILDDISIAAGGRAGPPGLSYDDDGKTLVMTGRSTTVPASVGGHRFVYPTMYYPGAIDTSAAQSLSVASGEARSAVNAQLQLVEARRVSGIVTTPPDSPQDVIIRLLQADGDDRGLGSEVAATLAARDGAFVLPVVPAGDYVIDARRIGSLVNTSLAIGPSGLYGAAPPAGPVWGGTRVSVSDGDATDVVINLRPAMTLSGHVEFNGRAKVPTAEQLARIPVMAEPATGGNNLSMAPVRVAADGRFSIQGILPGRYFIRVGSTPLGWSFDSATSNGRDVSDSALEAQPGTDIDDVVITFTDRPTQVTGTVRDARGSPLSSSTVIVFSADRHDLNDYGSNPRRLRNVRVQMTGVFTISGLPSGDYLLIAIDDADADNWQDPRRLDAWRSLATPLSIRTAEQKTQDLRVVSKR